MVWIKFIICLSIIIIAGTRLSKYGDIIAEKTGLGRIWIGVVLLATITSLPELATGVSSVALLGKPSLALGDVFGSNLFNLVIIALVDILYTKGPIFLFLNPAMILAAVGSILMLAVIAVAIFMSQNICDLGIGNYIGIYSLILLSLYLFTQYGLFKYEKTNRPRGSTTNKIGKEIRNSSSNIVLKTAVIYFVIAGMATIGAGVWLSYIGAEIATVTGLGYGFIGVIFMAACTSAPEMVVSIGCILRGTPDMAVGNLIGSNLFNMGIVLLIDDLAFTAGPILSFATVDILFTLLIGILMSAIVISALLFRPRPLLKVWISIETLLLIVIYLGAVFVIYTMNKGILPVTN